MKVIYLLLSIFETFGQVTSNENKSLGAINELTSASTDKLSNVLRDILNQESLVRFSLVQKIQNLMLDATDSKNDIEYLKKKLNDVKKELQSLESRNRQLEDENSYLYKLANHNNRTIETMKTWKVNVSLALDEIREAQNASKMQLLQSTVRFQSALPKDCKELHDMGKRMSGVYSIYPWDLLHQKSEQVYCDMDTAGGGWTVIQNRVDGRVNFSRNWEEYKAGFGDLLTSYWIGNDIIHQLTKENSSSLYLNIDGKDGTTNYIQYETFSISGEDDDYRLYIAGETTGTLDDRIRYGTGTDNINGMKFSTFDKDNDLRSDHCTDVMGVGGWWFNSCNDAYLNGQYPPGKWDQPWVSTFDQGSKISSTRMMIKRKMIA